MRQRSLTPPKEDFDDSDPIITSQMLREQDAQRITDLEAELRAANRECEVRNERELGYLARAQSAEAERDKLLGLYVDSQSRGAKVCIERDALKAALEIAFDYAMQNISEERERFAGYKPDRHAIWAQDEAQMRAAIDAARGEK